MNNKKYCKVRDHCHYTGECRGAAHSICNLKYSVSIKIPIVFHNGFNYEYHFIIEKLREDFKKQFPCLGKNTEKYITFTVLIVKNVTRIDENGEEIIKIYLTYYNLLIAQEGTHRIKCKYRHNDKNVRLVELDLSIATVFFECINFKGDLIEYKCLCCNKNHQHKFNGKFKERFLNTYKCSNHNNNKFILLLFYYYP